MPQRETDLVAHISTEITYKTIETPKSIKDRPRTAEDRKTVSAAKKIHLATGPNARDATTLIGLLSPPAKRSLMGSQRTFCEEPYGWRDVEVC
jgi:hypothetical protein